MIGDFAVPADHRLKIKKREETNQYLYFARELKMAVLHEGDGDTSFSLHAKNGS